MENSDNLGNCNEFYCTRGGDVHGADGAGEDEVGGDEDAAARGEEGAALRVDGGQHRLVAEVDLVARVHLLTPPDAIVQPMMTTTEAVAGRQEQEEEEWHPRHSLKQRSLKCIFDARTHTDLKIPFQQVVFSFKKTRQTLLYLQQLYPVIL